MKNNQNPRISQSLTLFLSVLLILTVLSPLAFAVFTKVDDYSFTVNYSFEHPTLSKTTIKNNVYDQVLLKDAPHSGNPGEPLLPTKGAYLLLPAGTQVDSIQVTGKKIFIDSGLTIIPCGKAIPLSADPRDYTPKKDPVLYASHELFPESLYTKVGVYQFRGYDILVLMLHPVQYIPVTGDLFYYPSLEVTVTLKKNASANELFRGLPQDHSEVLQKIHNPEHIPSYQKLQPPKPLTEQYDLLILTTDDLKNGFYPLAQQHNLTGTKTIIRTLTDVGGNSPEDIREYIRVMYLTSGISYVLLGGDADVIAARALWVSGMDENVTYYETTMPSDLYYACLDGPYNYNGNDKWGEPTDGEDGGDVDLIAEVYVGRACVDTIQEVDYFVQKTVAYLSLEEGATYLGDITLAGEYLGDYGIASYGGNYLNQLINGSNDDGYTTVGIPASTYLLDLLYDEQYPGFDPNNPGGTGWPKSEIIDRINNGVHIINHLGHAYYDYNMKMSKGDVIELTNTNNFCFIYSQGCMAGGFDNEDCIAEYFTAKTSTGAFAGIWNARYGWFWSYSTDGDSQRYHRQFWNAVFGQNIKEIGRANQYSKEANLFLIHRSCMRWCYYGLNLFGDPALRFWNASGNKPELHISTVSGGKAIDAIILNNGETPVSNIPWSISLQGGLLERIQIQSKGTIATLNPRSTITIQQDRPVFGLGKLSIQVNLKYAEPWHGEAFILGPFILRVIQRS